MFRFVVCFFYSNQETKWFCAASAVNSNLVNWLPSSDRQALAKAHYLMFWLDTSKKTFFFQLWHNAINWWFFDSDKKKSYWCYRQCTGKWAAAWHTSFSKNVTIHHATRFISAHANYPWGDEDSSWFETGTRPVRWQKKWIGNASALCHILAISNELIYLFF